LEVGDPFICDDFRFSLMLLELRLGRVNAVQFIRVEEYLGENHFQKYKQSIRNNTNVDNLHFIKQKHTKILKGHYRELD
jgi:hypothetical protein